MLTHDLADANLLEFLRASARWQEAAEVSESAGLLLLSGATAFPATYLNAALRTEPSLSAPRMLQLARAFFSARQRSFCLGLRKSRDADLETYCVAQGLKLKFDAPCMLVDEPLAVPPLPADVSVEQLTEARHVADLIEVSIAAYVALGLTADQTRSAFSCGAGLLDACTAGVIAYRNGRPLAAAVTVFPPGAGKGSADFAAGLYWIGTVPEARGQGLGGLCTVLATNLGFERGARAVTLQASRFGEPLYRRLGFSNYDRVRWYLCR
jgi:ribosomal protein S18 acetylase RimI-like enzyme